MVGLRAKEGLKVPEGMNNGAAGRLIAYVATYHPSIYHRELCTSD